MKQKLEFKSELSEDHKLFSMLAENPPQWWSVVKNHRDLYIEIRKDNSINIYYKGGSIAKIKYNNKSDRITAVAHPKYLGYDNCNDTNCYRQTKRNSPIYQACENWLENRLDEMLSNVEKSNNSKEKQTQSQMIISNRTLYIDSEFAHLCKIHFQDNNYKNDFMRIDLVELRNNTIRFVELKMIGDSRLLKKDEREEPEIFVQMQKYRDFAENNKSEIVKYYRTLYAIKKKLELPVCQDIDTEAITIDTKPALIIANDYDRETPKRTQHIERINNKMMQRSDVFDFEPMAEENYANDHS